MIRDERRKKAKDDDEREDADTFTPEHPPLAIGERLHRFLFAVGPTCAAGMGEGPITFAEIESWLHVTGRRLSRWDIETLRALSGEYLAEKQRAVTMGVEPPWKSPDLKPEKTELQLAFLDAARE